MVSNAYDTALQFHRRGNLRKAERFYRAHLKADQQHSGALQGLGIILAHQGKLEDAVALLRRALDREPASFAAHSNLGAALYALRQPAEAAEHFATAVALNPQHVESYSGLGTTLHELGRDDDARAAFEKAIALAPGNSETHFNLGKLHAELGNFGAAVAAYEKGLALAPQRTDIHRQMAQIKRYRSGDDPHLARLEALGQQNGLPPDARIPLDFALAKAYADIGDYGRALKHLRAGGAMKRQQIDYDESAALGVFERMAAAFPATATARAASSDASSGCRSELPVFVVGMPRSGTTLVEQILASHPATFGAGELTYIEEAARAIGEFPEAAAALSGAALSKFGEAYVARVAALAPGALRIVDKMPGNFQFLGLIARALPNARVIHVRRDPLDTCMSCFAQLFVGAAQPFTYELGELGRFYRGYERLMEHWREVLPPGLMLEIEYERLVADLPGEARRMVAHCGLAWDDSCLTFHATQRPVRTASVAQVRQPIYRGSVGRWQAHATDDALKPLLDALTL